jgi:CzcA family heavy metal efflux pump
MLNAIIRAALNNRAIIVCVAIAILALGSMVASSLPIDVLPDLTRPRVTIISECPGMAPEEVEREVTIPLEFAVNGAAGVMTVRSQSDIGLSVIYVEFDWDSDIYRSRQIVNERIAQVVNEMPDNVHTRLGPVASLLGQIMLIGVWTETGETSQMKLRDLADWEIGNRLRKISGISEVITMGGERKQYHVLVDVHQLHKYEVELSDVETTLRESNLNVNGGYVDSNSQEYLVRGLGRVAEIADLEKLVVRASGKRSVLLENIAEIRAVPQNKRGDSSINGFAGPVITIQKQPMADTRELTEEIEQALAELRKTLPGDVKLEATYKQREFIDYSVGNVIDALRDGAILVVIVLTVFLFNFRTTFITLTAIPISILITALVFKYFGLSINVMTLGGLAVALGELVDDAIVDVENIFRRLKQNAKLDQPRPIFTVVYEASSEVRGAILTSTILVIVVFFPLFALTGIEGRLFVPLGVAYIVSIVASTVVSLTLTPVLSYFLLQPKRMGGNKDSFFVRGLKKVFGPIVRLSLDGPSFVIMMIVFFLLAAYSGFVTMNLGKNFLPDFDEGAAQVNLFTEPGTSLSKSVATGKQAFEKLDQLRQTEDNPTGPIQYYTVKTGRAENDEHIMGVNVNEITISLNKESGLTRTEVIEKLEDAVSHINSAESEAEQPIAHLISHMISGVTAQIAIKLYGDELSLLRSTANQIEEAIHDIDGIAPPVVEQQQVIPQWRIEPDYERLAFYKLNAAEIFEVVETAMGGKLASQMVEGQRFFDVVLRLQQEFREDLEAMERFPIELPTGGTVPLSSVAKVYSYGGPNTINREDARRRIVIRVNTRGADLETVVGSIEKRLEQVELPQGYYVEMAGQFEAQKSATQRLLILSGISLLVVFVILYSAYGSISIVLQILSTLPIAFIGGVLALWLTGQTMTVAAMVGFISLGGIAARNGLLLVSTYLSLMKDGMSKREAIIHGSLERMTPVLMTATTTGFALLPLIIAGHLPGREILFPVATVIAGGLLTSTLCEFLVRPGLFYFLQRVPAEEAVPEPETQVA